MYRRVGMAPAAGGQYLQQYDSVSANLLDYLYKTPSVKRSVNDPSSPSYGLITGGHTSLCIYGDDNALRYLAP